MKATLAASAALGFALLATSPASSARSGRIVEASWYGPGLYGHALACGGRLQTSTVGVAHRFLPCGTRVTVCYRRRCIATRVIDRGPYAAGRELDLAAGLAIRLGFSGVHPVYCSRC